MVFNNSDLYDYAGEVHLTEDAYLCGANRTECQQVSSICTYSQMLK